MDNDLTAYTVKKLAKAAGVSVRTLHHYDRIGLLKPSIRTAAGYRLYGKSELLQLQQILFYKELDFGLKEIAALINRPDFDLISALESQKQLLKARRKRIDRLMSTLDKTILHIKGKIKMNYEELYEGLPKEQATAWRKEALAKWPDQVTHSEQVLVGMGKDEFEKLKSGFKENWETLAYFCSQGIDPVSEPVQQEIDKHYHYILRFWGKPGDQVEAYKGLGELYMADPRYTEVGGVAFGRFLKQAIDHYCK
ncbi:MerR family transcriptional regulator [Parapedobacter sp. GCM10030251]|uniref:MerR family transcriptional regulator n=1 Tax=Parapedobacter sp. GCM10030251 TaxID=3273419 RepID=UPI00360B18B2